MKISLLLLKKPFFKYIVLYFFIGLLILPYHVEDNKLFAHPIEAVQELPC